MLKSVLGILVLLFLTYGASAQSNRAYSAKTVAPGCDIYMRGDSRDLLHLQGQCVGTIGGLSFVAPMLPPHMRSCPPPGTVLAALVGTVLSYIKKNESRENEDFRMLALEALRDVWPCS